MADRLGFGACITLVLWGAVALGAGCAARAVPDPPSGAQSAADPRTDRTALAQPIGLPSERQPLPGVTTGGKPSDEQLRRARQLGYRTLISLLPESDAPGQAARATALGFRFEHIPIPDGSALSASAAQRLALAMDAAGGEPLILHCASGNRTGALLALRAFYVDGASREEALGLGERAGLRSLRPRVEELLSEPPQD